MKKEDTGNGQSVSSSKVLRRRASLSEVLHRSGVLHRKRFDWNDNEDEDHNEDERVWTSTRLFDSDEDDIEASAE
ncbi:hypothetical protein KIN20_018795 [Parelaphostrongylus tenuis]|uniref:Uncharacterized protein n=1 Tax=Parelaphostrongylus tenuis TaxID=148309 RepID=A0AAD5N4P2_PARTN|nr:hypothetical protein KIN20_018795 [Parelaphostrongylus tenuis]